MTKYSFYLIYLLVSLGIFAKAQSPGAVIDVQHYGFSLQLNDQNNTIKGHAEIKLKFLKDAASFNLDLVKQNETGKGMLVSSVTENGSSLQFQQDKEMLNITTSVNSGTEHTYMITYSGVPVDGLIISTNKFGHRTFFGDNWPNRAHNWLPCVDDPADKATVDFIITAPAHYQVVANGAKVGEVISSDSLKTTHWKESAPLSTKVMVIGVADFAIDHTGDIKGIPVYSYVFPENKAAGFKDYAFAKEILTYYIAKIAPYPFEKLADVQSKTIFGGLENASAIFYYENSVGDQKIEELMAHEIAHQWFGDAASEKSFAHLWLSEGFATFMTNVYLEHKYGIDTLKKRLKADREKVLQFEKQRLTPVVDTSVKNNYMQLLNPNSYEKGGWVLHMLRHKLGDAAFWKGIRAYYAKYNGGNANTADLQAIMEKAGGQKLDGFFKQWVYTPGTPHLSITWTYNPVKKAVDIHIKQQQKTEFDFPLEVLMDGKLHNVAVKNKETDILVPVKQKPASVIIDPSVNLLAKFEVKETIQ